jgi:beta-mannosidase
MTDHFRLPKDFESLVYLSQLLQAEAVRTGVEYWRRNRRCTSGALYWQLNDCWPVASWASLDYFGRWKALHYAARRFFAPVLLSAGPPLSPPSEGEGLDEGLRRINYSVETLEGEVLNTGDAVMSTAAVLQLLGGGGRRSPAEWKPAVSLFVTSDLKEEWQGSVRWSLETLDGEVLTKGEEPVTVEPVGSVGVCDLDFGDHLGVGPSAMLGTKDRHGIVLVYELWQDGERLSLGVMPFAPDKHLELQDPQLRLDVVGTDEGFEISATAERTARFVWLALEGIDSSSTDDLSTFDPGPVFSDNYFDIPAGRTVTVQLPALDGWTVERVRESLRVRSLVDSF